MMEVRGRVLPPPKLQYGGRVSSIGGQVSLHSSEQSDEHENMQILVSFHLQLHFVIKISFFRFHTFDEIKKYISFSLTMENALVELQNFSVVVQFII